MQNLIYQKQIKLFSNSDFKTLMGGAVCKVGCILELNNSMAYFKYDDQTQHSLKTPLDKIEIKLPIIELEKFTNKNVSEFNENNEILETIMYYPILAGYINCIDNYQISVKKEQEINRLFNDGNPWVK